jgi:hypothetical protein
LDATTLSKLFCGTALAETTAVAEFHVAGFGW